MKFLLAAALVLAAGALAQAPAEPQQAQKLMQDGNYAEALQQFRKLTLEGDASAISSAQAIETYRGALACYQQLGQADQIDAFLEAVVARFGQDWRVLASVGQDFLGLPHHGYRVAGVFHRGNQRGEGEVVNATARDRVRALQLLRHAMTQVDQADERETAEAFALCSNLAGALLRGMGYSESWRLQLLTDLDELPDYEDGWGYYPRGMRYAPVDANGDPVYFAAPDSWDEAANDGERWRWILAERTRWQPDKRTSELRDRAEFLQSQFSVRTMADYGWWFASRSGNADVAKSTFDLHTLTDEETIARLATGIKRFKMPEEHNFLALWKQIAADKSTDVGSPRANMALGQELEDRQQFPRAAEIWKLLAAANPAERSYRDRLNQIVQNWGRFEPVVTQRAGRGATLDYRFRNGRRVDFTARPVKVRELLADIKSYLSSQPRELDWQRLNVEQVGYRLVVDGQEKYLGAETARWSLDLDPRPDHFDRRVTVTTPLQSAGAYLVTAKMDDGNEHSIVVWIADTAIVKKPLADKALYYVADAVSGKPLAGVNVEFFGYWQEWVANGRFAMHTKNFAENTDAQGMVQLSDAGDNRHQWIAIATTPAPAGAAPPRAGASTTRRAEGLVPSVPGATPPDAGADPDPSSADTTPAAALPAGRLAFLGYSSVWSGQYYDAEYEQVKVYALTDRPVYRPDQEVNYKFWVANAKFDQADASPFAAQSFLVEITDPRGEKVYSKQLVADAYGGLGGTWKLPPGATLGQYQFTVVNHGGGSFRVEEYKKPEYEVTIDAPKDPVQLGDKITAKITAKYYFGSPVVNARVKYKVLRSTHSGDWFPPGPWDWLYGVGYSWIAEDYVWYPGWARWGCTRPAPWWFWRPQAPPEIVAESEGPIGPDGTLEVVIDTAAAKEFHPDEDHSYEIQAEVVDQSRRTIVAQGTVLAAREPFRVYVYAGRGYYRAGQTIELNMAARTLDGKPVAGDGVLRLLKIAYEEGKPVENEVGRWTLATDDQGHASLQIKAAEPGQYRVSYEVAAKPAPTAEQAASSEQAPSSERAEGLAPSVPAATPASGNSATPPPKKIEGGLLLTVRGEGFDGTGYRFNSVEVVPERREYAPGDKVRLQVSANRLGAAVLLFLRPANGVYLPPQMVQLTGKSAIVEFEVAQRDMPNFFVEAVTVHGGKLHTAVREIFVPPTKRVFNVDVVPSAKEYLPGEHATVKLKLTDLAGAPIAGSTVVAIYDKALDYIAGDAAPPDIREFFWKWRRSHNPQSETNLTRGEMPVAKRDTPEMQNIGVFGDAAADQDVPARQLQLASRSGGGFAGGRGMSTDSMAAPMAMAAAAPEGAAMKSESDRADGGGAVVEPTVRQEFADTALWVGSLETDADGTAEVELDMPENLTTWKVNVWGMGRGTRVGQGAAEMITRKNIIVRLQAPRFFVQSDEVVLSANVHNYLKTAKQVRVRLEFEGGTLFHPNSTRQLREGEAGPRATLEEVVEIPAGGEKRVDWRVTAVREGQAIIRMSALTDEESDAMQMTFPVLVHGMLKTESFSGAIRPADDHGGFTFTVPEDRRPEETRLEVRYSPTLAGAMVDALPYLADYPYGCTEQTLNRFLPAVLTQRTLLEMGVDLKAIQAKRTNLNAQEVSPQSGDDAERAEQWKRFDRNPVFDEAELTNIVKAGVNRLTEMQLSDGGWGWFSGWGEHSSAHTTATVVRGLLIAKQNDVAIVPGVLERGVAWLQNYQQSQLAALDNWDREASKARDQDKPAKSSADDLDALVYLVLTESERAAGFVPAEPNVRNRMRTYLYGDRTHLAVYSLATFGLALQHEMSGRHAGRDYAREMLPMIMRNISQYVRQDDENQTAWLELPSNNWWYWYGSEYEAHAYYLKLLAAVEPKSEVAPRMVKYLLNNRKHATYWNSTRDTALVVEAFADYLAATGEMKPNLSLAISIDGEQAKTVEISPENLFTFDNSLVLAGDQLAAGDHIVEIKKTGEGPVYFNGYLTNFTLEDDIQAAGLELKVDRRYYKLNRREATAAVAGGRGQAIQQAVEKYDRVQIASLEELQSGDLVEVELTVDSKYDYEYIVLEDMKAAGFEPVEVRSGYNGNAMGAYVEYRDERVALFCAHLARGQHSVAYRLRAEIPGKFSALPTKVSAMYAPELKANSDEWKVRVAE